MLELFMIASVIVLVIFVFQQKSRCTLPGPRGIFCLGPVFEISPKKLYLNLYKWSATYGDIFQFTYFGRKFVCLNSTDLIREAFSHEPNATILSSRPPSFFGKYLLDNYSDVALSPISKEWAKRRKLFFQLLHAYGEGMTVIENQITTQLNGMIQDIRRQSETAIQPQHIIEEFVFNNLEMLIVGKSFGRQSQLHKLLKNLDDHGNALANPGIDMVYHIFPFLRFLPLQSSRLIQGYNKEKNQMMEMLGNIAKEDTNHNGIFHQLLKVKDEADSSGSHWFTEANMKDMIIDLLGAGYLTTRGTLMSALRLLVKRPNIQQKIQKELKEKIGDGEIRISDREDCPYLEAVILETLRFISHVPLSVLHFAVADCNISGHHVSKDSIIIPNLWTAHHSDIWVDPFTFRPERFLTETGDLLPATHLIRKRLIPFGYGKRSCIGETFAKSRIFLFLANIFRNFSVLEPADLPIPDLCPTDMMPGISLQPRSYKLIFQDINSENN